ncbi:Hint domain-containing protein [Paracoccus alkanivorans]|uniref:Hedgehog/Intein (Hint) domain-containing protein n=1 Tax=Paracoccus alkanivorans TaxID=2116655 RepID=A0A3M0M4T3_9RHOB|nr:Hint domain-containing protein [Paracoccus alkanivorans]RMC32441.1 hypothetical protein C9E81_18850 [Paracoccus alkanivorans]
MSTSLGTSGNDSLTGSEGDDSLLGLDGDDTLDGGHGQDTLRGGAGNDSLFGGAKSDGSPSQMLDALEGGDGNDTLDGGLGSDDLSGGAGDDELRVSVVYRNIQETIDGGTGTDTLQIDGTDQEGAAFTVNLASGTAGTFGLSQFTLSNIENVVGGDKSDTLTGDDGANRLEGRAGNDSLAGGKGADTLDGGDGNDTLDGGNGPDSISGGAGNDLILQGFNNTSQVAETLDGGNGIDTVQIDGTAVESYTYDINLAKGTDNYGRTYSGIENVVGGDKSDTLTGDDGANRLEGRAGNDSLAGGKGADTLDGGDGNDTLDGGNSSDSISGGAGDDQFTVSDGHDVITDFTTGESGAANDGNNTNNDFIDLSGHYSQANYDRAVANGAIDPSVIRNPLKWMQADQDDDGVLNDTEAGWSDTNTLTIQNEGAAVGGSDLTSDRTGVMCFAHGTLITTPHGDVRIETLKIGDLVKTVDNGYKNIRWIGQRKLSAAELKANPKLWPICIRAGALGENTPSSDLLVSRQHRILIRSKIAQRMFGSPEVLVAAMHLTSVEGIDIADDLNEVAYYHMLFDQHEIVISNDAETESLYPGPHVLESVGPEAVREIYTLFPELREYDYSPVAARPFPTGSKTRQLLYRHTKNAEKQLCCKLLRRP